MGDEVSVVLKGVNLKVEEGEFIAILGPSGSGKSTLMNIIGCLDVPTSGEFYLSGRKIADQEEKSPCTYQEKGNRVHFPVVLPAFETDSN